MGATEPDGCRLRFADIDILALRRDSAALQRYLSGWDCRVADPPGQLRPGRAGESLRGDIYDVWCRQDQRSPWAFQVMLDESDGLEWQSRRCLQVTKPLRELGTANDQGPLFLIPEVQLFYRAKSPRAMDNLDSEAQAIERAYGRGNLRLATPPSSHPDMPKHR